MQGSPYPRVPLEHRAYRAADVDDLQDVARLGPPYIRRSCREGDRYDLGLPYPRLPLGIGLAGLLMSTTFSSSENSSTVYA